MERNASCCCGSGKKYKKCCLQEHQKERALSQLNSSKVPEFIVHYRPEVEEACDKALAMLERGDIDRAKKIAKDLISKYPDDHNVMFMQGVFFMQENAPDEAIASFEKAVEIFPIFTDAFFNLGELYLMNGQIDRSIESYKQVIFYASKGSELERVATNQINKFSKIVQKTCGISLDEYLECQQIFNCAYDFLSSNKYEEAIIHFQLLLSRNPKHVQSYGNIALAYSALGQNQKALECVDMALSLDPSYEPAIINRENILKMREGETSESEIHEVHYYSSKIKEMRALNS